MKNLLMVYMFNWDIIPLIWDTLFYAFFATFLFLVDLLPFETLIGVFLEQFCLCYSRQNYYSLLLYFVFMVYRFILWKHPKSLKKKNIMVQDLWGEEGRTSNEKEAKNAYKKGRGRKILCLFLYLK